MAVRRPAPQPPDAADAAADLAACRAALRNGSRTFLAASLLLPRRVREPACALYAFCRMADDAVDGSSDARAAVARVRERLDRACQGRPQAAPADRALAAVVQRFAIPPLLLQALLEGFEWDALGRRYETLEDVLDYAARVAGTVGAMMALLMGARSAEAVARACDLGVAMQLSNIARDVGEDARMGRLYLPGQWMREAGLDPNAWLRTPAFSPALGTVVQRLLAAADGLYRRADAGIALLAPACRPGIHAARLLYAEIGHEVARRGLDSVSQRAVVAPARKARLLARALLWPVAAQPRTPADPLAATRYLVEAVTALPQPAAARSLGQQALGLIDLFERLERRDRLRRMQAQGPGGLHADRMRAAARHPA